MSESKLQQACVRWFRYLPNVDHRFLIAIPNEGKRSRATASRMKAEGMVAGAPDLILFDPIGIEKPLFLECKLPKGRQSQAQKEFEKTVTNSGYNYRIFRSFDEFKEIVEDHLSLKFIKPFEEFKAKVYELSENYPDRQLGRRPRNKKI